MAIKQNRVNPVILLDFAVVGVERDTRVEPSTGALIDKGRKLTVQTAQGPELEVKVGVQFDALVFETGHPYLANVEYLEWDFDGRSGSTMRYHSFVSADQLDRWRGIVGQQTKAAAATAS